MSSIESVQKKGPGRPPKSQLITELETESTEGLEQIRHETRHPLDRRPQDLYSFESEVSAAKINNIGFVETTKDIYNYLAKGTKTPWLMYHGVRVYIEGTREQIEEEEAMSIDDRLRLHAERNKKTKK